MTFEPAPDQPPWARLLKIAGVAAGIVLAGIIVVFGASYLGRTVGNALGPQEGGGGTVDVEPGILRKGAQQEAVLVSRRTDQSQDAPLPPGRANEQALRVVLGHGVRRSALDRDLVDGRVRRVGRDDEALR